MNSIDACVPNSDHPKAIISAAHTLGELVSQLKKTHESYARLRCTGGVRLTCTSAQAHGKEDISGLPRRTLVLCLDTRAKHLVIFTQAGYTMYERWPKKSDWRKNAKKGRKARIERPIAEQQV